MKPEMILVSWMYEEYIYWHKDTCGKISVIILNELYLSSCWYLNQVKLLGNNWDTQY